MTIDLIKAKTAMTHLLECVKDKALTTEERKKYYSEYLQVSKNFLIMMRNFKNNSKSDLHNSK